MNLFVFRERLHLDRRPASLVLAILWFSVTTHSVAAEEMLVLSNGTRVKGSIEAYDERGVQLRHSTGRTTFYPARDIESVEANDSVAMAQGRRELEKRNYAAAIESFQSALASERRDWAIHRIRAHLIKAFRALGQWDEAAKLYLTIHEGRGDPEVLLLAPLVWADEEEIGESSKALARRWLSDPNPMARLLAASWLAKSAPSEAVGVLEGLTTDDARIGWMARSQLWRIRGSDLDADELARRRGLVMKMPEAIRGGPQFALAECYERGGRQEEAALAYLWVPYVYAPGSELAAVALLRAASASHKCGLRDEAQRIRREVVQAYPGTPWATRAESEILDATRKEPGNG